MYKYELDSLITDMAQAYRLHEFHVTENSPEINNIDFGMRASLYENYDYNNLFHELTDLITDDSPVDYADGTGTHYLIFREHVTDPNLKQFIVLGPYVYQKFEDSQINPILERNGLSLAQAPIVSSYLAMCPCILDYLAWQSFVSLLLGRYYNHPISIRYEIYSGMPFAALQRKELSYAPEDFNPYTEVELRYQVEQRLLNAVKAGNTSLALQIENEFMRFSMAPRDSNPLRDGKDMLIAVNTILRKAVEEAQVHPIYIDHLNAKLTGDIEALTSEPQLYAMNVTMIRRYCMLVQTYSRAKYTKFVRDAMNYIDFHYHEELSLSFFAKEYAVTKNYLSALFRQEAGMTITDYINTTRIRHALLLLNTTSFSMQEIAMDCGFSDSNYFTRTFKKYQGISPTAYRRQMYQEMDFSVEK